MSRTACWATNDIDAVCAKVSWGYGSGYDSIGYPYYWLSLEGLRSLVRTDFDLSESLFYGEEEEAKPASELSVEEYYKHAPISIEHPDGEAAAIEWFRQIIPDIGYWTRKLGYQEFCSRTGCYLWSFDLDRSYEAGLLGVDGERTGRARYFYREATWQGHLSTCGRSDSRDCLVRKESEKGDADTRIVQYCNVDSLCLTFSLEGLTPSEISQILGDFLNLSLYKTEQYGSIVEFWFNIPNAGHFAFTGRFFDLDEDQRRPIALYTLDLDDLPIPFLMNTNQTIESIRKSSLAGVTELMWEHREEQAKIKQAKRTAAMWAFL